MQPKDIHITFGRFGNKMLETSKVLNTEDVTLLNLEERLNIGPICDLDFEASIEKRKAWLQRAYGGVRFPDFYTDILNEGMATIKSLSEHSEQIKRIYLWTSLRTCEIYEILSAIRLLYHLPQSVEEIYMLDFPNIPIERLNGGEVFYPTTLNVIPSGQMGKLLDCFVPVEKDELLKWRKIWETVRMGTSTLRVMEKDGTICEKEESYYDWILEKYCTGEFQWAARVIGHSFRDVDSSVGDDFLGWRLKQLVLNGKLEARGILREVREYEVRKI